MRTSTNRFRVRLSHALASLGIAVLLAGCSGGDGGPTGPETTPLPTSAGSESKETEPALYELAEPKLSASLNGAYKVKPDGSRVPPQAKELPAALGSVEAHWYRSDGRYVIAFGGLDLKETGPVCPGSSVQTDSGFEHVTNSPTGEGACEGAPNIAKSDAGVKACGPLVLYVTEIPEDTKGSLFASVERYIGNGKIVGITGVVAADLSAAPEIDSSAPGYELPGRLIEGTSEVTC